MTKYEYSANPITFHKINGLQVIFTSSEAPITPGGI
jgi:hypothetical protein